MHILADNDIYDVHKMTFPESTDRTTLNFGPIGPKCMEKAKPTNSTDITYFSG